MRANRTEYLFSVNTHTPPTMTVESGKEFTVEVRGAFDDVEDIRAVPTPFTPACDGHPLAPITGPIVVRGAKSGDVVAIDLVELTPFGSGKSAILQDFGVLRREFPEPMAVSSEIRDGRAWFGGRIPLPLNPNLGTISTMPPEGYKPSNASTYGGDFDQKGRRPGEPSVPADAGRGRACILRRSARRDQRRHHHRHRHSVHHEGSARINLLKDHTLERPIIAQGGGVHFVGVGPRVEEATEDAARRAVDFAMTRTGLDREEAHVLLSIIGELRVGTSPRPVMATRADRA